MKILSSSDKETTEALFASSIYTNTHFGWFNCWQAAENNGAVWLDEKDLQKYLISLQIVDPNTLWLHSFFSTSSPENYPLAEKIRTLLKPGNYSVYAISSRNWFSSLLQNNGFKLSDEIIQMETVSLSTNVKETDRDILSFSSEQSDIVWHACENLFPPLWRLAREEFHEACTASNYRRVLIKDRKIAGYLLAEIDKENCDITRIAVLPEYQGKGYGNKIISSMNLDCIRLNIRTYSVNTNKKNTAALQFYKGLNFKQEGNSYPVFHRYIRVRPV